MVVATMALPHVTDSQEAEAWGAHLAMRLLLGRPSNDRRARVSGDNLASVCHCAAQGRLHRPRTQTVSELALSHLSACGWRRLNMAADAEAIEGVFWARRIRDSDAPRRQWRVRCFEG